MPCLNRRMQSQGDLEPVERSKRRGPTPRLDRESDALRRQLRDAAQVPYSGPTPHVQARFLQHPIRHRDPAAGTPPHAVCGNGELRSEDGRRQCLGRGHRSGRAGQVDRERPLVLALGLAEAWNCGSPNNVREALGWNADSSEAKWRRARREIWVLRKGRLAPARYIGKQEPARHDVDRSWQRLCRLLVQRQHRCVLGALGGHGAAGTRNLRPAGATINRVHGGSRPDRTPCSAT